MQNTSQGNLTFLPIDQKRHKYLYIFNLKKN
jgi:hypothetical protein